MIYTNLKISLTSQPLHALLFLRILGSSLRFDLQNCIARNRQGATKSFQMVEISGWNIPTPKLATLGWAR